MSLPDASILIVIAAGGAIGAVLRFLMQGQIVQRLVVGQEMSFPIATLLINVMGSFCIGLVFAWLDQAIREPVIRESLRAFLIVGLLGGFTTFSAVSLETVLLLEYGLSGKALLNIIASAVLCVSAAGAGLALVRWLV